MTYVVNIILIILVFGVIISFHEFGHFLLAKLNHVYVKEFAIGMGPSIIHFTKGETKYSLKLFPIGGYCMMEGEDEEIDHPRSFSNKNVWQRMSIVVAGPLFNFILAFVFSWVLIGMSGFDPAIATEVIPDSPAYEAGIEAGDRIVSVDGQRVYNYRELLVYMQFYKSGKPIKYVIERDGEKMTKEINPQYNSETDSYMIGIYGGYQQVKNVGQILTYSALELRYWIKTTVMSLKMLITGRIGIGNLSGPVGIATMMNETYTEASQTAGIYGLVINFINFCVLLSVNLGVMNLLPIPALDGGRLLFMIVEAITRKKIPTEKEALVHTIGFVILIVLMVVVMFHDVLNIFVK